MRSPAFRWRRGGAAPVEAPDAVAGLAALDEALAGEGWERVEEPSDVWCARRYRRPMVPLMQRIAPYYAEGAVTGLDEPVPGDPVAATKAEAGLGEAARVEAERIATERNEAQRVAAERVEAERVEAERVEAERVEAERIEAERVEAERVEAERLAAEQESPLRNLITSYSSGYDRDVDVRSLYGGECPPLDPARSARKFRRRRR